MIFSWSFQFADTASNRSQHTHPISTTANHYNQSIMPKYHSNDTVNTNSTPHRYHNSLSNMTNAQYQANITNYTPTAHLQSNNDDKRMINSLHHQIASIDLNESDMNQSMCDNGLLDQQPENKRTFMPSQYYIFTRT